MGKPLKKIGILETYYLLGFKKELFSGTKYILNLMKREQDYRFSLSKSENKLRKMKFKVGDHQNKVRINDQEKDKPIIFLLFLPTDIEDDE